jgi:hypothetical protein
MAIDLRKAAIIGTIIVGTAAFSAAALAAKPTGDTRPGWGYGDKNHVHTGPPGSVKANN